MRLIANPLRFGKLQHMTKRIKKLMPSGFVVHGSGMHGEMEGLAEVLFSGMVGALLGFILGMLFGSFARVFTINRVKGMIGGRHWAAWGAGAGALGLALIEFFD